ncbi:MAG: hypothetical protein ACR2L2_15030 [Acidobacteriota bacterium]
MIMIHLPDDKIRRFAYGPITAKEKGEVIGHLLHCDTCRTRVMEMLNGTGRFERRRSLDRRVVDLGRPEGDRRRGVDRRAMSHASI